MRSIIDIQVIKEYTHTLARTNEKSTICKEFLKTLTSLFEINNAILLIMQHSNFEVETKLGHPEEFINPEIYKSNKWAKNVKNCLMQNSEPHNVKTCAKNNDICSILLCKNVQERDLVVIPLGYNREILGFVLLEYINKSSDLPSKDLITILANQTYLALKHSFAQIEKDNLNHVASTLNSNLDIHTAYPLFVEGLRKLVDFERVTITIPNEAKGELNLHAQFHEGTMPPGRVLLKGSAPEQVFKTGKFVLEKDLAKTKTFIEDEYLYASGIRTALRLPLVSKGKIIGTFNVSSIHPSAYGAKHIKLLTELCSRISAFIENTLVYDLVYQQLQVMIKALQSTHEATLEALTIVLDARDSGTKGHCFRVVEYTQILAEMLGITGTELDNMRLGALLHDIGKIAIPDSILFKPGKLSSEEWEVMRSHPETGHEIVSKIEFLKEATPIILHHHERFDGGGYPKGLKGTEIPLGARIFSVIDAFDAMTSHRPYRSGIAIEDARDELIRCSGKQFDPQVVDAFVSCMGKVVVPFVKSGRSDVKN